MPSPYDDQLLEIRRRRKVVILVWLGIFPVVGGLTGALELAGVNVNRAFPLIALPCLGLLVIAGLRMQNARCPRCSKRFHLRGLYGHAFNRRCLNCGLQLDGTG